MSKTDAACYSCGEANPGKLKQKGKGNSFATAASVLFFMSIGLTIFSLFSEHAPPVSLCLAVSLVLLFVRSSADQFKKNRT